MAFVHFVDNMNSAVCADILRASLSDMTIGERLWSRSHRAIVRNIYAGLSLSAVFHQFSVSKNPSLLIFIPTVGRRRRRRLKLVDRALLSQYTPPTPTRRNCRVSSRRWCVHTAADDETVLSRRRRRCKRFATSSRRLPTDSVDNFETDQTDSIAFDYINFDKYW